MTIRHSARQHRAPKHALTVARTSNAQLLRSDARDFPQRGREGGGYYYMTFTSSSRGFGEVCRIPELRRACRCRQRTNFDDAHSPRLTAAISLPQRDHPVSLHLKSRASPPREIRATGIILLAFRQERRSVSRPAMAGTPCSWVPHQTRGGPSGQVRTSDSGRRTAVHLSRTVQDRSGLLSRDWLEYATARGQVQHAALLVQGICLTAPWRGMALR
jgi:hypothetical protein